MRKRLLGGLAAAVALVAAASGCGKGQPDASAPPEPASSFPFPVPPVTHTWKPDGLACPTLGASSQGSGLSGVGTRVRGTDSKNGSLLYCQWGAAGGKLLVSADLQLVTSKRQSAADAAWKVAGAPSSLNTPLPGVGEQAFIGPNTGSQFHIVVRSGNANLDITVKAATSDPVELKTLRGFSAGIATDMLSALTPA